MKIRNVFVSVDKGPETLVQIRRVIERMALNKDGGIGQRVVALGQMVQIRMRLASLVAQGESAARAIAFVVNRDLEFLRRTFEPCEVLAVTGNDQLKSRRHHDNRPRRSLRRFR